MNRRELLKNSSIWGVAAAGSAPWIARGFAKPAPEVGDASESAPATNRLVPPAQGSIPVAFLVGEDAVMIDFTGPWEVFQDVTGTGRKNPFRLFTVAESRQIVRVSGGMQITPDYTFADAPPPKVIVIPAMGSVSEPVKNWIRSASRSTDVTMSVCDGSFILASTGLLNGKPATAHHSGYVELQRAYPGVQVKRGVRWVESGNLASAGGLSSGIDLALHIVDRYFGRHVAEQTAYNMEYQGRGWLNPNSNAAFATISKGTAQHPVCVVCGMEANRSIKSEYRGTQYFFCGPQDKLKFDSTPQLYAYSG